MSDRSMDDLCPTLQSIAKEWLSQCKTAFANSGSYVGLIVTWRSSSDQDQAKSLGLSNAAAGQSPHNCVNDKGQPASKAFDFGVFEDNGNYIADGEDDRYAKAADIGKSLGLVWGGDWDNPDWDHLELPHWQTASAS
jgi:hypothetical protein